MLRSCSHSARRMRTYDEAFKTRNGQFGNSRALKQMLHTKICMLMEGKAPLQLLIDPLLQPLQPFPRASLQSLAVHHIFLGVLPAPSGKLHSAFKWRHLERKKGMRLGESLSTRYCKGVSSFEMGQEIVLKHIIFGNLAR